ncbi:MAG TPA: cell division protein FtsZ [Solirubrobacteraceae bacterium]|nr:cell division protein FtsZ [Solirubrobacteraceae bacterium]
MAGSNKRASMREGPLAALFRKTDEPEGEQPVAEEPVAKAPKPEAPPREESREVPHPSLAVPPVDEPRIAASHVDAETPRQRLRQAFSSEDEALETGRRSRKRRAAEPEPTGFEATLPAGAPVIRVVGVGGAGVNAINRMVEAEVEGVEFVAINTDQQSLQQSTADITLHIGEQLTRGLGAGANPDLGRGAAMEEYDRIKAMLKGSDMIFIAAGAGGGTGTGAAPIVARIAREVGALTVGIITKPFGFEGSRRRELAETGIHTLASEVDTLIVVPNSRLLTVLDKSVSMVDAFRVADDVLRQGVQGISDLVTLPGLINLDFADVRTIMSDAGPALLGIGMATGPNRAVDAAQKAVESPLLETSMEGARKILLSITGGSELSLFEVNDAAKAVAEAAHPEANIIFGATVDEKIGEEQVWVTVVATGYGGDRGPTPRASFEPAGEPKVERRGAPTAVPSMTSKTGMGVTEIDVPEFIPRR